MPPRSETPLVEIGGTRGNDRRNHLERINPNPPGTDNPAYIPGLDYVPPRGKGEYR